MSFSDLEKKIQEAKNKPNPHIPTKEEIDEAIYWVVENFPYAVTPSQNPGAGPAIQKWLDENIGPMDDKWTWLNKEIIEESGKGFLVITPRGLLVYANHEMC